MTNLQTLIEQIKQLTPEEKQQVLTALQSESAEVTSKPGKRIIGLHEHLGRGWMADDFDAELPDSFWLGESE